MSFMHKVLPYMSFIHTKFKLSAISETNIVDIKINNYEISNCNKKIIQK